MYEMKTPTKRKTGPTRIREAVRGAEQTNPVQIAAPINLALAQPASNEIVHEASGRHLLLTLRNCSPDLLNDEFKLRELTLAAAVATGATVLEICSHKFAPQGVTTLAVLAESHASLHTYPETNLVFWDCFTCGTTCDPELSVAVLAESLQATVISKQLVSRS